MQKQFAHSVSQALLYRYIELGYYFLESPEGMSYVQHNSGIGYQVLLNTIEEHYGYLKDNHENDGLDYVLERYCFALLEDRDVDYKKEEKSLYVLSMKDGSTFDIASLSKLINFCLEVENAT